MIEKDYKKFLSNSVYGESLFLKLYKGYLKEKNIAISTDGITPTFYKIKRITSFWNLGYRKMFFELYSPDENNVITYVLPYNEKVFTFLYENRNELFTIEIFNRIVGV